jgi:DNA-binding transcriptional ArsR family regulator
MPDLKEMTVDVEQGLQQQAHARRAADGPVRPVRRCRYQKGFLILPAAWNKALATLPHVAHGAAHCLLRRRWKYGKASFEVGNIAFGDVGITKHTKMAALKLLEDAGLITVELRGRRKSPVVTLHKLE